MTEPPTNNKPSCPECGSGLIMDRKESQQIPMRHGKSVWGMVTVHQCRDCGFGFLGPQAMAERKAAVLAAETLAEPPTGETFRVAVFVWLCLALTYLAGMAHGWTIHWVLGG